MTRRHVYILCIVVLCAEACRKDGGTLKETATGDFLTLSGKEGNGKITAVIRGVVRKEGVADCYRVISCANDEVLPTKENFIPPDGQCSFNVAVSGELNGFLLSDRSDWREEEGDELPLQLGKRVPLDVKIWIMDGDFGILSGIAGVDLNRAEQLFNGGGCGMEFKIHGPEDLTHVAVEARGCSSLGELIRSGAFNSQMINVYYVDSLEGGDKGKRCPNTFAVFVSGDADGETLAHEIGHTMTLRHTTTLVDIPVANLMKEATGRDSVEAGQCFRANLVKTSALYVLGKKSQGPYKQCDAAGETFECPGLRLLCQ